MDLIGLYIERENQHVPMRDLLPTTISQPHFERCLSLYSNYVRDVYHRVEKVRFEKIPTNWKTRDPRCLTKEEVCDLDRWIQKRGTPLTKEEHIHNTNYILSNSDHDISEITSRALTAYRENDPIPALAILGEIEGVEPIRASLLLSAAYPETVPFLSLDLFQWMLRCKTHGWQGQYCSDNFAEDRAKVFEGVQTLTRTFHAKAIDVEKVAFVLKSECQVSSLKTIDIPPLGEDEPVGIGAFGQVYKVKNLRVQNRVRRGLAAVKRVNKIPALKRHRFLAEVANSWALAESSKDSFVELLGWNEDGPYFYVAMEYIELGNLEENLSDATDPSWGIKIARDVTKQILEGLLEMHAARMAHRDLKPQVAPPILPTRQLQNILVARKAKDQVRVKISDFGTSKRRSDRGTTVLATFAGTPIYMAPEVTDRWVGEVGPDVEFWNRQSYTEMVDLWSVGCITFRMVAGNHLFDGSNVIRRREDVRNVGIMEEKLVRLGTGEVVKFMEALLKIDPEERPSAEGALGHRWILEG